MQRRHGWLKGSASARPRRAILQRTLRPIALGSPSVNIRRRE